MAIYLGLGSNLGTRADYLSQALEALQENNITVQRVSPVYETPALLMPNSPPDWNRPFLNCVTEVATTHTAVECLALIKTIEQNLGRDLNAPRWAPRPIDIDILLWHDDIIRSENLTVPHPEIINRAFVLDPLSHLIPNAILPSGDRVSFLTRARAHAQHQPLLMGILNITHDSFSDGGKYRDLDKFKATLKDWANNQIPIFDIGAESTRPNATALTPHEEWDRLHPYLEAWAETIPKDLLAPRLSLDTYHPETAQRAIHDYGLDILNDVSGLQNPKMRAMLHTKSLEAVAMHSLSIPVDKSIHLPEDDDPFITIKNWMLDTIKRCEAENIDCDKIIFDPGIGFGKTTWQSLSILQRMDEFQDIPARILCGHSRKSFLNTFTTTDFSERDPETLGLSMAIKNKGVDILRVHAPLLHKRAMLSALHII